MGHVYDKMRMRGRRLDTEAETAPAPKEDVIAALMKMLRQPRFPQSLSLYIDMKMILPFFPFFHPPPARIFHFFAFSFFRFFRFFFSKKKLVYLIFHFSPPRRSTRGSPKHRFFPTKNPDFEARFWVREVGRKERKKDERRGRRQKQVTFHNRTHKTFLLIACAENPYSDVIPW